MKIHFIYSRISTLTRFLNLLYPYSCLKFLWNSHAWQLSLTPHSDYLNDALKLSEQFVETIFARLSATVYQLFIKFIYSVRFIMSKKQYILILILMEYTLWEYDSFCVPLVQACLNPYSNGIYSMRTTEENWGVLKRSVLILILMEYTLWATSTTSTSTKWGS